MMDESENQGLSPAQKRLESLEKKKRELERKIREEQRLIKKAERDRHTLRLISMGILVASEIKAGIRSELEVKQKLDKLLTQDSHRLAWGLEPLAKKENGEKVVEERPIEEPKKSVKTEPKAVLREKKHKSIEDEFQDLTK